MIHVVIDLGNVHDVLRNIEAYIDHIDHVVAYADYVYNGYGVSSRINHPKIDVIIAETPHKNSADVNIIWDVSRLALRLENEPLCIIVCTRDLGFLSLKDLVQKNPKHRLHFAAAWPSIQKILDEATKDVYILPSL